MAWAGSAAGPGAALAGLTPEVEASPELVVVGVREEEPLGTGGAIRLALPAYSNEVILMLKASALASTITLLDLTGVARVIVARSFAPYELFLTAGVIYLLMTFAITRAFRQAEFRLNPHLRPPPM